MNEHDFEPVPGLPALLPAGERVLWQGAPQWQSLALHAFHVRKVIVYFVLLALWRLVSTLTAGEALADALAAALWPVLLGLPCVALLAGFAWASARSTMYTITNRRVVLRIGVALPMSINIPFSSINAAALRDDANGIGDVSLTLMPAQRVAYAALWPHARRWQFAKPQPMLRTIARAAQVAHILGAAIQATADESVALTERKTAVRIGAARNHEATHSLAGATS